MAKSIATLRKEAKDAGIPYSELRGLSTADEIQAVIDAHSGGGTTTATRPVKKKRTVAKKKNSSAARPKRKATAAKKSTARKTGAKKTTAKRATAKKSTAKKSTATRRQSQDNGGRNLLGDVDYSVTDGWNPREGSAPDRIVKALKRFRGNRDKVFEHLKSDLWDFVGKTNARGAKRSKAEAEWNLRYRISRTAWDFAKRTGQHEPSQNRATYGEGGTGIGVSGGMPVDLRPEDWTGKPVFKRGKKRTAPRKATTARKTASASKKRATTKRGSAKRTAKRTAARRK